ncbi:MAG: D-aminoacylase [Acidimicrobiales bacterium]|nr:D-aminoacylase [Acidimicrobiales bacterium]
MADTVIRNATIIDGTGAERFTGDVTVEDGHISEVGSSSSAAAVEVDATGLVLAPGFVDVHTHDDGALLQHPDMAFKISQGCTSVVVGNCGFSAIPAVPGDSTLDLSGVQANWSDLDGYRQNVENSGPALNAMMLVGHNTIRSLEMGNERRAPNDQELERMQQHVELAMEQGACGFSTGLVYRPGRWSDTDEILELAKIVAPFDGIYATHMRNENDHLLEAVDEALEIGTKAGVAVQISHHKAAGERNWGKVEESLAKVDAAVAEGAEVTLDVYPYTAGSGPMVQYFDIDNPNLELAQAIQLASCPAFRHYEGRMLVDIAAELGITAPEAVRHVLTAPDGKKTICIQHVMDEGDVVSNLRHDRVMIGSDGLPDLTGRPHPRLFGTFPRVLGRYVREQGVVDLENAVRRMTSLSCDVHGLSGRGRITEGNWADLVLFDPDVVIDVASYEDPKRESVGIRNVWVNGHMAFDNGVHTRVGSGNVLRYRQH